VKAAIFFGCALASAAIHADTVYRSVGPDGKVTYSQRPPAEGKIDKTLDRGEHGIVRAMRPS
jgi:hypothetical protein